MSVVRITYSDIEVALADTSFRARTWWGETRLRVLDDRVRILPELVGWEVKGPGLPAGTRLACIHSGREVTLTAASTLAPAGMDCGREIVRVQSDEVPALPESAPSDPA